MPLIQRDIQSSITQALALLRAGELVAFPTETVYGLGADATNPVAVAKIFAAKGRPENHPLIVHLPSIEALPQWATDISDQAWQLAKAFWPGPLTLILKRSALVLDCVTGGQDTVGLRVPRHPIALALLAQFGGGIAAPSANRFGRISPTTAEHVREELGDYASLILEGGACELGIESTIIDCSRGIPVILRPGAITLTDVERILGPQAQHLDKQDKQEFAPPTPRVSGSMDSHYAPLTPLRLVASNQLEAAISKAKAQGFIVGVMDRGNDARHYAHHLYARLRKLDQGGYDVILVELPPQDDDDAWLAVLDRLMRAAG